MIIKRGILMKKLLKIVYRIFLIVIIIGLITGVIDYFQLKNNDFPLFALRSYEAKSKKETFRGLFYKATRTVTISQNEAIYSSKDIKFIFFVFNIPLNRNSSITNQTFYLKTTEEKSCQPAKLLFFNGDTKVYTYCLDTINILDNNQKFTLEEYLNKDISIINKIINNLFISKNDNYLTQYIDKEEKHFTNKGLSIIQCHKSDNNDIYLGPRAMEFQDDFCTNKDDIPKDKNTVSSEESIPSTEENIPTE